ncbi:hypothetical protein [Microbacterium ureisolvens]|uniref:Uncharacterized protein n=1 Tax=Microbacterium ureisolvens TaxID=2781186 RepID=A0ABS7HXT7_9MICO|nr:hypothetical protein [Microbacterium ureisolvens]MBW9109930.1 hypothetical protein [Microbacterium ureisolvens]
MPADRGRERVIDVVERPDMAPVHRPRHWAFEYSATVAAEKAEHAFTSQIEHSVPLR